MKKFSATAIFLLIVGVAVGASAAGLEIFLSNLNIQAKADMDGFSVKLGAQFGVPLPTVQAIIKKVDTPAEAFMALQIGQMTNKEPDMVITTYNRDKKKGWGAIAQELGIKPGSAEFHALKSGDLSFTGKPGGEKNKGKDKGKGGK